MKKVLDNGLHSFAAILTWCVVFGMGVILMRQAATPYAERMVEFVLVQVGFFALMLATVRDYHRYGPRWPGCVLLFCALGTVYWLGWRFPISFLPIYSIMWITLLPFYFSTRSVAALLVLTISGWYIINRFGWEADDALMSVLLYGTFHMFAMVSSLATRKAEFASEHARDLNRGLLATQQLLADAAKENERTRIARDLHDQFGHHMTALTIKLQVASRLADGEVKEAVDQCHDLSKQLLSDVRKAVSTLREHKSLDLESSLRLIIEHVPGLAVHLDVQPDLDITDVTVAEAVIRCVQEAVTNTLRHARATESWIRLWQEDSGLRLQIHDNGHVRTGFIPGNGLAGMRERIEKLNGILTVGAEPSFTIRAELPLVAPL